MISVIFVIKIIDNNDILLNVPIFVYEYRKTFRCDRSCKNKFKTVVIVFGITALLFYTTIPILTKR